MKAKQTLNQNDLITEVVKLVRFPLDIAVLKQRIDHLIEGDYMKRDENDRVLFHYVA
jgi:cullin 3